MALIVREGMNQDRGRQDRNELLCREAPPFLRNALKDQYAVLSNSARYTQE
jgi:hypothetical protein